MTIIVYEDNGTFNFGFTSINSYNDHHMTSMTMEDDEILATSNMSPDDGDSCFDESPGDNSSAICSHLISSAVPLHRQEAPLMNSPHIRKKGLVDDGSISTLSEIMMERATISPFASPHSESIRSIGRRRRVRFEDVVTTLEIPNRESFALEEKRRLWWTKNEEDIIEREVHSIANMIDLNRLPSSKSSYGIVRGAVAYTTKAILNRSFQRDRLYNEVHCVQQMHQDDSGADPFERAAKQSLKRMLIAKLCENLSQLSTQHALEIARLDSEQAELVYDEAMKDIANLSLDDLTNFCSDLQDPQQASGEKPASVPSHVSSSTTTIRSNE
jgi:hypothetical protein